MRSPDLAWVLRARLAELSAQQKRQFLPLAPDALIERPSCATPTCYRGWRCPWGGFGSPGYNSRIPCRINLYVIRESTMNPNRWPQQLAAYPYAQPLLIGWQIADHTRDRFWTEYERALDTYLASQDRDKSPAEQRDWLMKSKEAFQRLVAKGDGHIGTHFALVRIQAELGDRQAAMDAIQTLLQAMPWLVEPLPDELELQINRPFVAPTASYDGRGAEDGLGPWLQLSLREALDELERPELSF